MTNQGAVLEKLVTTGHLSVAEHEHLGREVAFSSIASAIKTIMSSKGVFPPHALRDPASSPPATDPSWPFAWMPGRYFEACILEQSADGKSRLWFDGKTPQVFESLDDAIREFARRQWRNQIDGIPIVWTK
jgi:hypothetical protein